MSLSSAGEERQRVGRPGEAPGGQETRGGAAKEALAGADEPGTRELPRELPAAEHL